MVVSAPATTLHQARPATKATLDAFEALGIAVFPQEVGRKGSRVHGWPEMPTDTAIALTHQAASRGEVNVAGRTGAGVAVLDPDAKGGADPAGVVASIREAAGDAIIAIVKTRRGYHVWLAVTESVGNGYCSGLGGEVFSEPHLAMLPPSIHPEGQRYEWVIQPREPSAKADLRQLGFVPDEPTFRSGIPQEVEPAPPHVQAEFQALMAGKEIVRGKRNQELFGCPWHDDREPSLSINWDAALFHCFGEECLVGGGISALRRLLGKHTPTYRQGRAGLSDGNWGCVEDEVRRLADGLTALGHADKAQKVRDCKRLFAVGHCTGCSAAPVYPLNCGQLLCPQCMESRLAADWREHAGSIPDRLNILKLIPRDFWGLNRHVLGKVRSRFREWRQRAGVSGGIYGIRLHPKHGAVVLLALPVGLPLPQSSRAFEVEVVEMGRPPDEFLRWLQAEYTEEARSWQTDEDLALLLEETRRRRRFQGFGGAYASEQRQDADEPADEVGTPVAQPLRKVSGGSNSGGSKRDVRLCPLCGGRVEMYDFTVRFEEVRLKDGQLQWLGPPGSAASAA